MKKIIILFLITLLLSSCGSTPKVMTYYKELGKAGVSYNDLDSANKIVKINAFVLDPDTKSDKTIFDFSEAGQSAIIEDLGKKSTNAKELFGSMALSVKESSQKTKVSGNLSFKKRIVININVIGTQKADRLERINFKISIPDALKDKIEFVSWDKIATETVTIDLGKIIGGTSTTTSFSPEIGMSGTIQGKLAAEVSNTKTFSEEKSFSEKMAGLSAALINKNEFEVNRSSLPNENISGNIIVEVTLKAKNEKSLSYFDFDGLYNGAIAITDQNKIRVNEMELMSPDFGYDSKKVSITNIPLLLSYDFLLRKVIEGQNTVPEYDDVIQYVTGFVTATSPIILSDSDSWAPKLWYIVIEDKQLGIQNIDMEKPATLAFTSYEKAQELIKWIKKTKSLKVSDYKFYLVTNALKTDDIKKLTIGI